MNEPILQMAQLLDKLSKQHGQMLDVILKLEKRIVRLEDVLLALKQPQSDYAEGRDVTDKR